MQMTAHDSTGQAVVDIVYAPQVTEFSLRW
jgi:hypothetical protein